MTTFSQLLHNRLTNIPAVKDLLAGPSTQSLRQRFNMRLELGNKGTFAYILLCLGLIASVFYMPMVLQQIPSAIFWSVWGASAIVCAFWGLYFGRWIYSAAYEWHKKAEALGLGYVGICTDFENSSATVKVSVIELCTKAGANSAQIEWLYEAAKDHEIPKQWWWDLEEEAEKCLKEEQNAECKTMKKNLKNERELLAHQKIEQYVPTFFVRTTLSPLQKYLKI